VREEKRARPLLVAAAVEPRLWPPRASLATTVQGKGCCCFFLPCSVFSFFSLVLFFILINK
jgi:hypothetical protein